MWVKMLKQMDKKSFTYDVRKPKKGGILEMAD